MTENLTLIRSSNTQAILKQGKKLKFVGEGVDFQAYQNGDDSILTLKNSNIQPPIEDEGEFDVEIDMILYSLEGVSLRGRISEKIGEIYVQKLGDATTKLKKSRTGQFNLENIKNGIYTFTQANNHSSFNQSNPSMKMDIAVVCNRTAYAAQDPNDPMYDLIKSQTPRIYNQYKRFPWDWHLNVELTEGPDTLNPYQFFLIDNDDDWKRLTLLTPTEVYFEVSDNYTNVELYNDVYRSVLGYAMNSTSYVLSHQYKFIFP
jgi:hypothetical protein